MSRQRRFALFAALLLAAGIPAARWVGDAFAARDAELATCKSFWSEA